jgi:hypothetical protein
MHKLPLCYEYVINMLSCLMKSKWKKKWFFKIVFLCIWNDVPWYHWGSHLAWSVRNSSLECLVFIEWCPYLRRGSTYNHRSGAGILVIANPYTWGIIVCRPLKILKEKEVFWHVWILTCIFHVFEMKVFLTSFIVCCIYIQSIWLTLCFYV